MVKVFPKADIRNYSFVISSFKRNLELFKNTFSRFSICAFVIAMGLSGSLVLVFLYKPVPVPSASLTMPSFKTLKIEGDQEGVINAQPVASSTVSHLLAALDRHNFNLESVRKSDALVPRILPDAVPIDLASVNPTSDRKEAFIRLILPMILVMNERIEQTRQRIIQIRHLLEINAPVSSVHYTWLKNQFSFYTVKFGNFDALLTHIDIAPPSLALAQAAIESGWGSSRFAREGNALFGQWTTEQFEGLIPIDREAGATHKIRVFDTPSESVQSYIRNLNTHNAYREFRKMRASMREAGRALDSVQLAQTLDKYSEKGTVYVDLLISVIHSNQLKYLDDATLVPYQHYIIDHHAT